MILTIHSRHHMNIEALIHSIIVFWVSLALVLVKFVEYEIEFCPVEQGHSAGCYDFTEISREDKGNNSTTGKDLQEDPFSTAAMIIVARASLVPGITSSTFEPIVRPNVGLRNFSASTWLKHQESYNLRSHYGKCEKEMIWKKGKESMRDERWWKLTIVIRTKQQVEEMKN